MFSKVRLIAEYDVKVDNFVIFCESDLPSFQQV